MTDSRLTGTTAIVTCAGSGIGVNGFTHALRQEVTQKHVRVGVIEPGAMPTSQA